MRVATATACLVLALAATISAQTAQTDEQQIRDLIAKIDAGQSRTGTKDRIFWSAAYKRPVVAPQQPEEVATDWRPSQRVPGSQSNKTTPVRIEVAKSSDMAYEFSNQDFRFQTKDGKQWMFPVSGLRVWKKEEGQWLIAAEFSNHYQEPTAKP